VGYMALNQSQKITYITLVARYEVLRQVLLRGPIFNILVVVHVTVKHLLPYINTREPFKNKV
jgi:hypothetical protein